MAYRDKVPRLFRKLVDKINPPIPEWVKELSRNSYDSSGEEMGELALWFSQEENARGAVKLLGEARDPTFKALLGAAIPEKTLRLLVRGEGTEPWVMLTAQHVGLYTGMTKNSECRKIPDLWEFMKENLTVSGAMDVLDWVPEEEAQPFVDIVFRFRPDRVNETSMCDVLRARPRLINLLTEAEIKRLLKTRRGRDRQAVILALGALDHEAVPKTTRRREAAR